MSIMRLVGALAVAMLPTRMWDDLDTHVPVLRCATLASALTLVVGLILAVVVVLEDHPRVSILFLLTKWRGWIALYLIGSGTLRLGGAIASEPQGDPLLTIIDAWAHRRRKTRTEQHLHMQRLRREGPEVQDRLISGTDIGRPDVALAVIASRRKSEWTIGTTVLRKDDWFRVADVVEQEINGRLRTVYMLVPQLTSEVARRVVRYPE